MIDLLSNLPVLNRETFADIGLSLLLLLLVLPLLLFELVLLLPLYPILVVPYRGSNKNIIKNNVNKLPYYSLLSLDQKSFKISKEANQKNQTKKNVSNLP